MARKRFDHMNCAAAQALEQIGDWWTLLLVREAFYGTRSFSDFQSRLGIAKNILADRLAALVKNGVFVREPVKPGVDRHLYRLSEKGEALLPVLVALMQWGDRWVLGPELAPLRILDAQAHEPIEDVGVFSREGRRLTVDDLRFRPGPGADAVTTARLRSPA